MSTDEPIVLYKYKDVSGDGIAQVEAMLRDNRLWFSSPKDFNDPFDCRAVYDLGNSRIEVVLRMTAVLAKSATSISDALAEAERKIPRHPDELHTWLDQKYRMRKREVENTGILCLTRRHDNQLMWTHYANGHTGVCIRFRPRNEREESQLDFIASAFPIDYTDRCPMINVVRDDPELIVRKTFLTKLSSYAYEEEWRIVRYNKGRGLKRTPGGIIDGVILGARINSAIRGRVIKACKEYDGKVDILTAALEPQGFGLRFEVEESV